jgi:tetratricopeptide (TPR) repeat protein
MTPSHSLAAVFVVLMFCQAFAANWLPVEADERYKRVMELYNQRKFAEALPLAQQAVAIDEKAPGPNQLDFAKDLNLLGLLYHQLRHYAEAGVLTNDRLPYVRKSSGRTIRTLRNRLVISVYCT